MLSRSSLRSNYAYTSRFSFFEGGTRRRSTVCLSALALVGASHHAEAAFVNVINVPADSATIAGGITASDTQLNVSDGGTVASNFKLGSQIAPYSSNIEFNLSGGTVNDGFEAVIGTSVYVTGGEFLGLAGSVGAPVTFNGGSADQFVVIAADLEVHAGTFTLLTAQNGFSGEPTRATFEGGIVSSFATVGRVEVTVNGGEFGVEDPANTEPPGFVVSNQGTAEITGGLFKSLFGVQSGDTITQTSAATISGGTFEAAVVVAGNSDLLISGGEFTGEAILAGPASVIQISGGEVDAPSFGATERGTLSLIGTELRIDGAPVLGLEIGQEFLITQRDVLIEVTLADGNRFALDANPTPVAEGEDPRDVFDEDAFLLFTLVPEPSTAALLGFLTLTCLRRRRD